jgi:DNA-binding MarR family transcriptional regulator
VSPAPAESLDRHAVAAQMIAQFRVVLGELKCLGSQRLLRRGVSMANLHVLSMLERHGEMAMSRVADALDISYSNATGIVDRMEERGLVARVRDEEDRRVVHVRLTDAGRTVLSDIEIFRDEAIGMVLDQLDDRQLASLAETLSDLGGAVTRAAEANPETFAHDHRFHEAPTARS